MGCNCCENGNFTPTVFGELAPKRSNACSNCGHHRYQHKHS